MTAVVLALAAALSAATGPAARASFTAATTGPPSAFSAAAPAPPSGAAASRDCAEREPVVRVSWAPAAGATGYIVSRVGGGLAVPSTGEPVDDPGPARTDGVDYEIRALVGSWASAAVAVSAAPCAPWPSEPSLVTSTYPGPGDYGIAPLTSVTATFGATVDDSSVAVTLTDQAGDPVPAVIEYLQALRTLRLVPLAPLEPGALHTATATALTSDGAPTDAFVWTFTVGAEDVCPCGVHSAAETPEVASVPDTGAMELGLRLAPRVDGTVIGIRFFRGPGNPGPHPVTLWTGDGTPLATASAPDDPSTGWRTVLFEDPVDVTAGTEIVASYHAPAGGYASSPGAFAEEQGRGLLTLPPLAGVHGYGGGFPDAAVTAEDYFVDVLFRPATGGASSVMARSPESGSADVPVSSGVSVQLSRPVRPSTVELSLTAGGAPLAGTVSYDDDVVGEHVVSWYDTVRLRPTAPLPAGTTIDVTFSAEDHAGATLGPVTWSFTTAAPADPASWTCPCTLWGPADVPEVAPDPDDRAVEVGVRIVPATDGRITAIRFHRAAGNPGPHVVTLWGAADRTVLSRVTAPDGTPDGWQEVVLDAPVTVQAGAEYVASYWAPEGRYSITARGLTAGREAGALSAPAGGNGVFRYGGGFPDDSWNSSDYAVDVVFVAE